MRRARTERAAESRGVEKYHSLAIPSEIIEDRILLIRGQKVMIDHDLAVLYAVTTRHLKRQVRRNIARFPEDFMFRLTKNEKSGLVPNWHRFETLKKWKAGTTISSKSYLTR
jgi:hypothetical protein